MLIMHISTQVLQEIVSSVHDVRPEQKLSYAYARCENNTF